MPRCILCGWPLDDEHVFNIHCAAANAEAEQTDAEVAEILSQPESQREDSSAAVQIALDNMALMRFFWLCRHN